MADKNPLPEVRSDGELAAAFLVLAMCLKPEAYALADYTLARIIEYVRREEGCERNA